MSIPPSGTLTAERVGTSSRLGSARTIEPSNPSEPTMLREY